MSILIVQSILTLFWWRELEWQQKRQQMILNMRWVNYPQYRLNIYCNCRDLTSTSFLNIVPSLCDPPVSSSHSLIYALKIKSFGMRQAMCTLFPSVAALAPPWCLTLLHHFLTSQSICRHSIAAQHCFHSALTSFYTFRHLVHFQLIQNQNVHCLLLFFHLNEKRDVHLYGMKLTTLMHGQGQTAKMMGGGGGERPYVLHCFQPAVQPTAKNVPELLIIIDLPS